MSPLRIRISLKPSPPDEKIDSISSKRRKTNNGSNIVSSASSYSLTSSSLSEGDVEFPCVEERFIQPFSLHRSMSNADSSLEESCTESNARLVRHKFSVAEHEDFFLPPNFPDAETNAKSQYEDPVLLFLESLRGATANLDAAEVLLNAEYKSLNRVRNSIRKGLGLFKKQYASQESFSEAFEEWKQEFADAVKAECGDKYDGCLNLGDALNPLAVALMIAHFAPGSCKSYDDTKNLEKMFRSLFCKIARDNECMRMFDWILAKSLHKEAGGVWSEDIRRAVSERFSIVDAKILVTEVTDDHVAEFNTFCTDYGAARRAKIKEDPEKCEKYKAAQSKYDAARYAKIKEDSEKLAARRERDAARRAKIKEELIVNQKSSLLHEAHLHGALKQMSRDDTRADEMHKMLEDHARSLLTVQTPLIGLQTFRSWWNDFESRDKPFDRRKEGLIQAMISFCKSWGVTVVKFTNGDHGLEFTQLHERVIVSEVRLDSQFAGKVSIDDQVVSINAKDVKQMSAEDIQLLLSEENLPMYVTFVNNELLEKKLNLRDHTYTAEVPVVPGEGVLLNIANGGEGHVVFNGYRRKSDGSPGPAETGLLLRSRGDIIIAVNGRRIVDEHFRPSYSFQELVSDAALPVKKKQVKQRVTSCCLFIASKSRALLSTIPPGEARTVSGDPKSRYFSTYAYL
eukprot:scaffold13408_cov153-Skeletonema_marinoi.AAC.9